MIKKIWSGIRDYINPITIGIAILVGTFLLLKLTGRVNWSWWWIFSPIIGAIGCTFVALVFICPLVVGVVVMLFLVGIHKTMTALPRLFHGDEALKKGIS